MGRALDHARPSLFEANAFNNMVINAAFDVSQEKGTNTTTITNPVGGASPYFADGWIFAARGTMTVTAQQIDERVTTGNTFPGNDQMALFTVNTAQASLGANDYVVLMQAIEGVRIGKLNWGYAAASPITLAFLFHATLGGTYSGSIRNGAQARSYPFSFTVAGGTPTWITVTIPGDVTGTTTWQYGTGVGMYLCICLAGGTSSIGSGGSWQAASLLGVTGNVNFAGSTSNAVYVGSVIMLPGNEAPTLARAPYILRPYTEELRLCQRYFWRSVGTQPNITGQAFTNTAIFGTSVMFPVTMRAIPTMTVVGTWSVSGCGQPICTQPSPDGFTLQASGTSATNIAANCNGSTTYVTADARL